MGGMDKARFSRWVGAKENWIGDRQSQVRCYGEEEHGRVGA